MCLVSQQVTESLSATVSTHNICVRFVTRKAVAPHRTTNTPRPPRRDHRQQSQVLTTPSFLQHIPFIPLSRLAILFTEKLW